MRLVGAGKWRVRAPFVIEHILELMVGVLLAWGALWAVRTGLYAPYVEPTNTGVKVVGMRDTGMALLGVAGISLGAILMFSMVSLRKITR